MMQCSYGVRDITPSESMTMRGFIPDRKSTGVQAPLHVKVLTFFDGEHYYGWMVTDVLGNTRYLKECILKDLSDKGLSFKDLQMNATHTHSAPIVLGEVEHMDPNHDPLERAFFDQLVAKSVDAFVESTQTMRPFKYRLGHGEMKEFQSNRIDQTFDDDKEILTVEIAFDTASILIYSFGGHPTILNRESTLYSPDYVGVVADNLNKDYAFTMFINAPCGDMSTRFYRKESTLAELERLGTLAATHVREAAKNHGDFKTMHSYHVREFVLDLKLKTFDTDIEAEAKVHEAREAYEEAVKDHVDAKTLRVKQSRLEGALVNQHLALTFKKRWVEGFKVYIIDVDDAQIINMSGEIFSELVKPLKEDKKTWLLSLSDQYLSYLPNQKAFDLNTYEALSSVYEAGQGEVLVETIKSIR